MIFNFYRVQQLSGEPFERDSYVNEYSFITSSVYLIPDWNCDATISDPNKIVTSFAGHTKTKYFTII